MNALRIVAPNAFTDSILIVDDAMRVERTLGSFTTDASVAYVRQDQAHKSQTLALANATKFSDGTLSLLTSSAPITLQVSYVGDVLSVDGANLPPALLRVAAQNASRVMFNNNPVAARRDQNDFLIDLR